MNINLILSAALTLGISSGSMAYGLEDIGSDNTIRERNKFIYTKHASRVFIPDLNFLSWASDDTEASLSDLGRLVHPLIEPFYENRKSNLGNLKSALRRIPAPERENFIRLIVGPETRLVTVGGENAVSIIMALSKIQDSGQRETLVRLITAPATRLVSENLSNVVDVINALGKVRASERENLVRLILEPETRLVSEDRSNATQVIDALRWIPVAEREGVVRLITDPSTRLLSEDRGNAYAIINDLRGIPAISRVALVRLITDPENRLLREDRDNADDVINDLRGIPAAVRWDRVIHFRNHIDIPPSHPGFRQRLRQLIINPLSAPTLPLAGGMEAAVLQGGYTLGINVHAGGRDEATTGAYLRLLEMQRESTPTDISLAYEDFMRALEALTNETMKRNVRIALGLEMAPRGGFEGLNSGPITSYGLYTNYQELTGRLWYFANTYVDPRSTTEEAQVRERENARYSIFAALADSLETDGHLVCTPGKLQRLAASVLQGRLAGVNIDGSVVEESSGVTTPCGTELHVDNDLAWGMFEATNPFREPFLAQTYRERAEAFIRENPRVNAPWMRKEVEDYISDPLNGLVEEEERGDLDGGGKD